MKYWEDFISKWGFSDGEAVPPDAEALRGVYIRKINAKAAELGSAVRLFAYDRPGMHNPYLILRVMASDVRDVEPARLCIGTNQRDRKAWTMPENWDEPSEDIEMEQAIDYYQDTEDEDIDELVESVVRVIDEDDPEQTELTEE